MQSPLLKEAYKAISKIIKECQKTVKEDEFCSFFCREKEQHSFQVLSAGEYILKGLSEPLDEARADIYRFAALMHDVGRFKEIKLLMNDKSVRHDHGLYSAQMLTEMGYTDMSLHLAILHHGHMLNDFYTDKDYLALSDEKKKEAENLLFFVRDADKIANLKLFMDKPETGKMEESWLPKRKQVGSEIIQAFTQQRIANYRGILGVEDWYFARLSWIFELHYIPSFDFIRQYHLVDRNLDFLKDYVDDAAFLDFCRTQLNHFMEKGV